MAKITQWTFAIIVFYLLQCLFNSVASAVGLGFPYNTFLFSPADLFSDFIQTIYSYRIIGFESPSSFFFQHSNYFQSLSARFEHYRLNNAFSDDPAFSSHGFTNFHFPPITQLYNLTFGYLIRSTDPLSGMAIAILLSLIPLAIACLIVSPRSRVRASLLFLLVIVSYPSLLALTRGNLSGLLCSTSLVLSMLLFYRKRTSAALVLSAISLSIRPNWLPLVLFMLLCINSPSGSRLKFVLLLRFTLVFVLINGLSLLALRYLHPDFTLTTFLQAYKYYSHVYEYGDAGLAFGSSLLGAQKIILRCFTGSSTDSLISALRYANIFFSISSTLLFIHLCGICKVSIPTASLGVTSLCILGTPVFADYHLLAFVGPAFLLCNSHPSHPQDNFLNLDLCLIAIAMLPFAYYPEAHNVVGVGVVFRPLFLLSYVLVVFLRSFNSTFWLPARIHNG